MALHNKLLQYGYNIAYIVANIYIGIYRELATYCKTVAISTFL